MQWFSIYKDKQRISEIIQNFWKNDKWYIERTRWLLKLAFRAYWVEQQACEASDYGWQR
ncbi:MULTISPECIES: hypothetical protein [Pantoea]|uniref:hypothetical protein n=1 Tax=Pantoea TaxID=53335 RepID=UPI0035E3C84C